MNASQIQNLITSWEGKDQASKVYPYQEWIDFHSKPYVDKIDYKVKNRYYSVFKKELIEKILPNDKMDAFLSLLNPPSKTVNFTDDLFDEIGRVLESANYSMQVSLPNKEQTDFMKFLNDEGIANYWRSDVIDLLREEVNGIMICDIPPEGGNPYYYLVDPSALVYCKFKSHSDDIEEIMFVYGVKDNAKVHYYTSEFYSVWSYAEKKVGEMIVFNKHKLGQCPARFFWDKALNRENKFIRRSPIAKDLANYDWLLFYETAKRYSDTYAPFPIIITYEQDDDEFNEEDNRANSQVGAKGKLSGAGSHLTVPPPLDGDDMMRNPMKIISSEVANLDYVVKEIDRLKDEISKNVIGAKGDLRNDAAKNEDQIKDAGESRKKKLLGYKDSFNGICSWTFSMLASLKYNKQVKVTVDYGNDFYLRQLSEMYSNLKEAKEKGSSTVVIDALRNSINEQMFKGDTSKITRIQIIDDIDPAPGKSIEEAIVLKNQGLLNVVELDIHINMSRFIRRFERDKNETIEMYVLKSGKEYNLIINEIFSIFESYSTAKDVEQKIINNGND